MMKRAFRRRGALQAGVALGLGCMLPTARACEYFSPTLRVFHPWTRASATDAGFAMVCMTFDEVTRADRLVHVETPVAAGVEMGGLPAGAALDLPILPGQATVLSEAGVHLRLVGLRQTLEVARSYPLKLVFEQGGVVNAMLSVDYTAFRFK